MSGYQPCGCRDCFEIAIGDGDPTLCHDCDEHDCSVDSDTECNSPHAYGSEPDPEPEPEDLPITL